jgi:riboflavin synthase
MAVLTMAPAIASAGQKLAIFPIDMSMPKSEEDFFRGVTGPTPEEQARLEMAQAQLQKLIAADGRYDIVDLSSLKDEITAAQPIHECNGCEIEIAGKAKADLVMTGLIDKISETHLSLNVAIIDVAQSKLVSNSSVLIQGNTDESWMHGVRWLVKNRLLAEAKPK